MPRMLTLIVLPLLAAASLTAAGSVDPDSFLRTAPYELITDVSRDAWCEEGDEASALAEAADLRGAHFSFSLDCLFKAPKVPEDLAASIPVLEHVPPAQDGTEFLFAQVALPAKYNAEYTYAPSVLASWIEVGGDERIDLATAPAVQNFYVLSVPLDEPAVLWVDDSGRTQGIDLRTGEQVDPVAAYYNGLGLRTVDLGGFDTEKVNIFNGSASGWIRCETKFAKASRFVWRDDVGWAADGTVFLEVKTNWCSETDNFTWELDQERAFTVDGEAPLSWTATESNEHWDSLVLVFAVPADAAETTIDFSPVGTIELKETGEEVVSNRLPNFAWRAAF